MGSDIVHTMQGIHHFDYRFEENSCERRNDKDLSSDACKNFAVLPKADAFNLRSKQGGLQDGKHDNQLNHISCKLCNKKLRS